MRLKLEEYREKALSGELGDITGFVLCCFGTVRSSFWQREELPDDPEYPAILNRLTYWERDAQVFRERSGATNAMNRIASAYPDLWKYMGLLPVMEDKLYLLPTIGGRYDEQREVNAAN